MQIQDILYSQGFGTRRVCAGLVQRGLVAIRQLGDAAWTVCDDPAAQLDEHGLQFSVQGVEWVYQAKAYLMLHKPSGVECSQKPAFHPSVYSLLPAPLRQRPAKGAVAGVQSVGRLDQDTTGLLLLSDDGQFIHRMSSPRKLVPKVYQVTTKHPVTSQQVDQLLQGVLLDDEPRPVRAAACVQQDEFRLDLTLTEGKYHQVKRMVAASGNRVEALHRAQIGQLQLPEELAPGQWRWLEAGELHLLA